MEFRKMFEIATGFEPFYYQEQMAGEADLPSLLEVPTGMGKTAAAILSWVWRRQYASPEISAKTPRRLVYCLPMRVLVEQTRDCAITWLNNLGFLGGVAEFEDSGGKQRLKDYDPWAGKDDPTKIRVHLLMGGDVDRDWDMYPERNAILIGTQDMLLSRALNRGYALSRFRWPMQFGLLNNDCLWVMDEVQLMGNGLATTTQLQAFRRIFRTAVPVHSLWMSATIHEDWLNTVDFVSALDMSRTQSPEDEDRKSDIFQNRYKAKKRISKAPFTIADDGKDTARLAEELHRKGTLTLIMVNTVKRAQNVYARLAKLRAKKTEGAKADLILVHSRFRQPDREKELKRLLMPPGENGTIAVCTQVIEAGVDVSAKTLITELAPWSSLVQRFGRCNRYGEYNEGTILWIAYADLEDEKKLKPAPYEPEELHKAFERLNGLTEAAPERLPAFHDPLVFSHVLRHKDLIELFDTTPDLAGSDIDVSRFIREADEYDVQVFWRDIPPNGPSPDEKGPSREELCSVPISKDLIQKTLWRWDHLEKRWAKPMSVYPGLVLMLDADQGGYTNEVGWTGKGKSRVQVWNSLTSVPESNDDDKDSYTTSWQTIDEHTELVMKQLSALIAFHRSDLGDMACAALWDAARWHDAGKAHPQFQQAIPEGAPDKRLWGKSACRMKPYERKGFRHELASALAMLNNGVSDLAAYLAAAHHGKVRLSIRSLPHEKRPSEPGRRFARGIWDGDVLPATKLCKNFQMRPTVLKLTYMELGEDPVTGPSWLARMLKLRDNLGPFQLAFLETLLRIADWRASSNQEDFGIGEEP